MRRMAGAAGFEPAITGSKPDALPLGYAPSNLMQADVNDGQLTILLKLYFRYLRTSSKNFFNYPA